MRMITVIDHPCQPCLAGLLSPMLREPGSGYWEGSTDDPSRHRGEPWRSGAVHATRIPPGAPASCGRPGMADELGKKGLPGWRTVKRGGGLSSNPSEGGVWRGRAAGVVPAAPGMIRIIVFESRSAVIQPGVARSTRDRTRRTRPLVHGTVRGKIPFTPVASRPSAWHGPSAAGPPRPRRSAVDTSFCPPFGRFRIQRNADLSAFPCGTRKWRQNRPPQVVDSEASCKSSVQRSVRRESQYGSIQRFLRGVAPVTAIVRAPDPGSSDPGRRADDPAGVYPATAPRVGWHQFASGCETKPSRATPARLASAITRASVS